MSATKAGMTSASYWFHLALRRACKADWLSSKLIVCGLFMIWFRNAFVSWDGKMVSADHASWQTTALPWPRIIVASAMACNLLAKRALGVKGGTSPNWHDASNHEHCSYSRREPHDEAADPGDAPRTVRPFEP